MEKVPFKFRSFANGTENWRWRGAEKQCPKKMMAEIFPLLRKPSAIKDER